DKQSNLTGRQQRAINALLSEPSIIKAAEAAKVSKATMYRWLADAQFSTALKEARGRALESTLTGLQGASVKAVETLYDMMNDEKVSAAARVNAAGKILEMSLRVRDLIVNEDRISAIETLLRKEGKL